MGAPGRFMRVPGKFMGTAKLSGEVSGNVVDMKKSVTSVLRDRMSAEKKGSIS
jgi:hypothetical protein